MRIYEITIGERHRRSLGDVASLAESIRQVGLLHPVVVRPDGTLIAGARRVAAARLLGWDSIPVTVVDLAEIVRGEQAENTCRLDFTPSEAVAIARALEPLEREAARQRQGNRTDLGLSAKLAESDDRVQSRDRIAAATGLGRTALARAAAVVEAAESDPERFGPLQERMDRTGRVNGVYKQLHAAQVAESLRHESPPLPDGPFDVLLADPPWEYHFSETATRTVENQYPTLSLEAIRALPVAAISAPDSVLFLWSTSPKLGEALSVLSAWGYTYTTSLVWVKDRIGMGYYARQRHEFLLIGKRGAYPVPLPENRPDSVIEAPRALHSQKPDVAYDVIERMYPQAHRVELFARVARAGWSAWGNENR